MEIGLDLKVFAAKTVSGLLKEVWAGESGDGKVAKLEESVRSLEEEKRKVEAFKRELPLCMHLLTDVIEALKKDLDQWRGQRFARVFGELVPIKSELGDPAMAEEKKSWMCSAQLWRDSNGGSNRKEAKNEEKMLEKRGGGFDCLRRRESLESKSLTGGGAFVPFKALSGLPEISKERAPAMTLSTLSLPAPAMTLSTLSLPAPPLSNATLALSPAGSCSKGVGDAPESAPATAGDHLSTQVQQQQQQPRKVRRCWSPELHRHFLSALEQLGGAQVATPKQIRELMKVEGLTNDEVKSHLQKYRLHSRGKPKSSEAINQPLPASGVATSSEEQHSTSSQQSGSQSGSPQSPLQLAWPTRVGCEEEHGRSESHSWK